MKMDSLGRVLSDPTRILRLDGLGKVSSDFTRTSRLDRQDRVPEVLTEIATVLRKKCASMARNAQTSFSLNLETNYWS